MSSSTLLPDETNPNAPIGIVTGNTSSVDQVIESIHFVVTGSVHISGHTALGVLDLVANAKADATGDLSSADGSDSGQLFWWDTLKLVGLPGRALQATLKIQNVGTALAIGAGQGDAGISQSIQTHEKA